MNSNATVKKISEKKIEMKYVKIDISNHTHSHKFKIINSRGEKKYHY